MACGCESTCGCNVVGVGYIDVTRTGDTFSVGVDMPIRLVEDTDCIALSVDEPTRTLRAVPILATAADEDASVQLRCSATGLAGDVVIDPASSAPVTLTPDGLRIDLPPPPATPDAASPGTLKVTSSLSDEAGWLDTDGGEVSRLTFPELHDAVSLVTTAGGRTLGSGQITGARTKYLKAGMPAEVSGFPPGMTVVSIDGAFTLTVSDVAFSSGADTEVRVYPYGNGDGGGTFNLPLIDDDDFIKQMAVGEGLGTAGGESLTNLTIANMPPHEHVGTTATDSGHGHAGSTASSASTSTATTTITMDPVASHNHEPGTARDSEFVTVDDPLTGPDFVPVDIGGAGARNTWVSIPTYNSQIGQAQQGNRSFTSNDGGHTPTGTASTSVSTSTGTSVTIAPGNANISVDVALEGGGVDFENRPQFRAFRWVVKT